jgi:hypothetical protein
VQKVSATGKIQPRKGQISADVVPNHRTADRRRPVGRKGRLPRRARPGTLRGCRRERRGRR